MGEFVDISAFPYFNKESGARRDDSAADTVSSPIRLLVCCRVAGLCHGPFFVERRPLPKHHEQRLQFRPARQSLLVCHCGFQYFVLSPFVPTMRAGFRDQRRESVPLETRFYTGFKAILQRLMQPTPGLRVWRCRNR